MATSTLKGIKNGTLTAQNGFTLSEVDVKQIGNVCYVKFCATNSSGTGTSQIMVAKLSGIALPTTIIRKVCGAGGQVYSTYYTAYSSLTADGDIYVTVPSTSRPSVALEFTYIV